MTGSRRTEMAAENDIMARVRELVEQERQLRDRAQAGELSTDEDAPSSSRSKPSSINAGTCYGSGALGSRPARTPTTSSLARSTKSRVTCSSASMDVESDITALYALPLEEFVAARNALAKRAKSEASAELAASIKALRKPTTTAWLANQLARERADTVDELVGLGEQMRAATDSRDGDRLR